MIYSDKIPSRDWLPAEARQKGSTALSAALKLRLRGLDSSRRRLPFASEPLGRSARLLGRGLLMGVAISTLPPNLLSTYLLAASWVLLTTSGSLLRVNILQTCSCMPRGPCQNIGDPGRLHTAPLAPKDALRDFGSCICDTRA